MLKFPKINTTPLMAFFANVWLEATRIMQARLEHMRITNGEVTALVDGEVLYMSDDREGSRAISTTAATADAACISCEPTAVGAKGVARTSGLAFVLFVPGLVAPAPAAGQAVYTSDTAGRASNAIGPAGWYTRIGTIEDASTYGTLGGCYVNIERCCTPSAIG
jgi:hypothetical protein